MSSTVLEIGNDAATVVGLPTQSNLVGSGNQNAVKILKAVVDAANKDGFRQYSWAQTIRLHTFTTDGSSTYALPSYFHNIIDGTIWDRTNYRRLIGPMTPVEWQKHESGLVNLSGIYKICRINTDSSGNKVFQIYPSTDTGSEITYEYVDTRYVVASGGDLKEEVTADDDTFLVDDDVVEAGAIWRLLRILGLNYSTELQEYNQILKARKAEDSGAPILEMQLRHVFLGRNPHIPDTGFGVP